MRTKIFFLTKKFVPVGTEKVNVVGALVKAALYEDSDSKEEAKYLDREVLGFRAKGKGLIKIIGTLRKGIKVKTIIEITTTYLGKETRVGIKMVI